MVVRVCRAAGFGGNFEMLMVDPDRRPTAQEIEELIDLVRRDPQRQLTDKMLEVLDRRASDLHLTAGAPPRAA